MIDSPASKLDCTGGRLLLFDSVDEIVGFEELPLPQDLVEAEGAGSPE